jgi:hypothetical protein
MLDVENVGIISSACICNGGRGRLLFERLGRDSKKGRRSVYRAILLINIARDDTQGRDPFKSFQLWGKPRSD